MANKGISFIICTFNGAERLPKTLACIASQKNEASIPWEVILFDNGSTDETQQSARQNWPLKQIPLKIMSGTINTGVGLVRLRCLSEAAYEYAVFIDDDNWIENNWVEKIFQVMESHPEVAVCGSFSEAVCELKPPAWFNRFKAHYAVGPDELEPGYVPDSRNWLWAAGMAVRKSAWREIINAGFCLHLTSRVEGNLLSGEDIEMCYAFRLAGWKLWFEPALRFKHFISAKKLNWNYLKDLYQGFGRSKAYLCIYQALLNKSSVSPHSFFGIRAVVNEGIKLLRKIFKRCANLLLCREGDAEILYFKHDCGRFLEMLTHPKECEKCYADAVVYAAEVNGIRSLKYHNGTETHKEGKW